MVRLPGIALVRESCSGQSGRRRTERHTRRAATRIVWASQSTRRSIMATLKEIATRARVSIGTVSNVITGSVPVSALRRERILAAIREFDYHPNHVARSLRLRRTRTLGMVISDITNPFFSQMVRGAEDAALEHNYLLLMFNTDDRVERERQALTVLRDRQVDGILLVVASGRESAAHAAETVAAGTPVVCLDRFPPGVRVDSVTVDNLQATRECVRHLLGLGHRRIAILTGSLCHNTARERLQGYKEALKAMRLRIDPELIRTGDFRVDSGHALGLELLSRPDRPSAVFTSNGLMAMGVLKAVTELRLRCPRDVAIATFDDLPMSEILRPPLTSVAQPAYLIGYKGAELLIKTIELREKSKTRVQIRLRAELRIRESTQGVKC